MALQPPTSPDSARVAVVIVNYRTPDLALKSVEALYEQRKIIEGLRVVLVDGGSGDGSAERLAAALHEDRFRNWVQFLPLAINGGFGWANNQAILTLLQGNDPPDFIWLLNPDAIAGERAGVALLEEMKTHPKCAAVGSLLLEMDGEPSGSAFLFPSIGEEFARAAKIVALTRALGVKPFVLRPDAACDVPWVTGASVMLRSAALREVGLFDDGFFLYFEEVDLMWRLRRAGWTIRHQPLSLVRHVGGAATGVFARRVQEHLLPRRPAYWYHSRRRHFALSHGVVGGLLSGLGWLLGEPLGIIRTKLLPHRSSQRVEHELCDMLRIGLIPRRRDLRRADVTVSSTIGQPPLWMYNDAV